MNQNKLKCHECGRFISNKEVEKYTSFCPGNEFSREIVEFRCTQHGEQHDTWLKESGMTRVHSTFYGGGGY